ALAIASGAEIAAHPSYPDRDGFGRRAMVLPIKRLRASIAEQCATLREVAGMEGASVRLVKAHGALYHEASVHDAIARAVVGAAFDALGNAAIVGKASSRLHEEAARARLPFVREGFADRGYDARGALLPRGAPGALLLDPAAAAIQAIALVRR